MQHFNLQSTIYKNLIRQHEGPFVLGALAALWKPAFSLREETYTIGSASLEASLVLGESQTGDGPLEFVQKNGHPGQTWFFDRSGSNDRDFSVQNVLGAYINCGEEAGSPCLAGEDPQIYTLEFTGDNKYQFVAKGSGYFLRVNENRQLELAEWDQTPNEEFTLTST